MRPDDLPPRPASTQPVAMEPSREPAPARTQRRDTIVIGGGQAGLAVGYHLAQRGVDFVVLEAGARIGDSWRRRWDSLRLFTPARHSGLPGMRFPAAPGHLPDKDQVADYLERYADACGIPVRTGTRVEALWQDGTDFVIDAGPDRFVARNVVVATGPFQRPRVPALASQLRSDIHQLHSHDYRNPGQLPDGDVLVVGAGNSGAQIALELARSRKVVLAGESAGSLPRTILGADVFQWLWPVFRCLHLGTWAGRRLRERSRAGDPLIGIGRRDFAANGVRRVGRVGAVQHGLPCVGGEVLDVRVVLWATGFAPDFGWIHLPAFGADGMPRHRRGVARPAGLYFVGQRFLFRQSSALLGGVGDDAAFVAGQIADRAARKPWTPAMRRLSSPAALEAPAWPRPSESVTSSPGMAAVS